MKVVKNSCYGGFSLSEEAVMRYAEIRGLKLYSDKKNSFLTTYYLVPKKEYDKQRDIDKQTGDYSKSNLMYFSISDIERNDSALIQAVEELGEKADGRFSALEIVDIPDDVKWEISEYDGLETVEEVHRKW